MNDKPTPKILLVEDEQPLAELMRDYLLADHYQVDMRLDGTGVVDEVRESPPDLILLDLMLPGEDGLSICTAIRRFSEVPIIITTARVEEVDRLLGLELGADDYVCKPYRPREVVARVKAVLRRSLPREQAEAEPDLLLSREKLTATYAGNEVNLTPTEFRLLEVLAERPGQILSRDQLQKAAYTDQRVVGARTVDAHIKNLRQKLAQLAPDTELIRSIYGAGYKLN